MELRQAYVVAASNTQPELTPVKPMTCPGGCGLCCGVTRLAGSGSVCGLVAADVERSHRLYDPCCWSREQLRQLIASPTQAGFHVAHVPIIDNGEIPAANGSFDIAILGIVAAVQSPITACQSECAQTPRMATSDVARCVELLRKHGCRNISILNNDSDPLCRMKDSCDGPGTDCRGIGSCKPAFLSVVVAQVEA